MVYDSCWDFRSLYRHLILYWSRELSTILSTFYLFFFFTLDIFLIYYCQTSLLLNFSSPLPLTVLVRTTSILIIFVLFSYRSETSIGLFPTFLHSFLLLPYSPTTFKTDFLNSCTSWTSSWNEPINTLTFLWSHWPGLLLLILDLDSPVSFFII